MKKTTLLITWLFALAKALHATHPGIPGTWEITAQPQPLLAEITARPAPSLPVYGLYCWADEYLEHRAFIRDIGWRHVRLSGPVNDAVMRAYSEDGMSVMFTLAARRSFATPAEPRGEWRNRGSHTSDEAFIADYLADVEKVIARYGPSGSFWAENPELTQRPLQAIEIYNESNFWYLDQTREQWKYDMANPNEERRIAQEAGRQRLYGKLLSAAYARIKSLAPSLIVVGFGTGGSAYADVRFISAVHALLPANQSPPYDVLSTHPYVDEVPPETDYIRPWGRYSAAKSLAEIRESMRAQGTGEHPVWWTELNWTVPASAGGRYKPADSDAGHKAVPLNLQAAYVVRAYARALRLGVDRLHLMSIKDTDTVNSGFLNDDGTRRPSATAVQTMIRLMPKPRLVAAPRDGEDGIYVYQIKTNADAPASPVVTMAWSVLPQTKPTEIVWPHSGGTSLSMLGVNTPLPPPNAGYLALVLNPEPVYLTP
jgi:hypothetical protein